MHRRSDIALLIALLFLGAAYQWIFLAHGVGLIDEGHLANGARRLAGGEVLYRDVYTVYPPASFYLVSGLFELFGTSLRVVRTFHAVLTLALAAVVFWTGRTWMPRPWAFAAALLVGMTGWEALVERVHYAYLYGVFPLLALACLLRDRDLAKAPRGRSIFGAGLFAGLTLAFRLVPFVAVVAAAAVVLSVRCGRGSEFVRALGRFGLGVALAIAPLALFFVAQDAGGDLFRSVFWTSFGQYIDGGEFNLPFPPLEWWPREMSRRGIHQLFMSWEFHLPPLIYAATFVEIAVLHGLRRESWDARALWRAALATFGSILFLRATGRSDYYHLVPVLMPAYLLGAEACARILGRTSGRRREVYGFGIVAIMMAVSIFVHDVPRVARGALSREGRVELQPGTARVPEESVLDDLLLDLEVRTRPEDPILVLPWYPVLYFLSERTNPTRFDWLFPGYLDGESGEREFIEEIERARVRVVVYSPRAIDGRRERSLVRFAPLLDRHLRCEFRAVEQFGHFLVLVRRDSSARRSEASGCAAVSSEEDDPPSQIGGPEVKS